MLRFSELWSRFNYSRDDALPCAYASPCFQTAPVSGGSATRADYLMLTRHQFWKLFFQRLEQLPELLGMSAAEFEALKER